MELRHGIFALEKSYEKFPKKKCNREICFLLFMYYWLGVFKTRNGKMILKIRARVIS